MTINIEDVRPGDVVTLEHPEGSRLVGRVSRTAKMLLNDTLGDYVIEILVENGWTITNHKPKVELPTEPGYYVRGAYAPDPATVTLYMLGGAGLWSSHLFGEWRDIEREDLPSDLTRLVPESENRAEIAGKVLDWAWENTSITFSDLVSARKYFGVS